MSNQPLRSDPYAARLISRVEGRAVDLPDRLHLLQDVQDRLFGLRKVVELDSHSSSALLSFSAVADLAHHLEGDGRPGRCLNLDQNPVGDEIAFGARKLSRVLKEFKASAEKRATHFKACSSFSIQLAQKSLWIVVKRRNSP